MKEAIFASEFKKSLFRLKEKYWYYKIPDTHGGLRFTPLKPFDAILVYNSIPIAIEFKQIKTESPFPLSKLPDHQRDNLLKFEKSGGKGVVIINYRIERIYNKCFCLPISDIIQFGKESKRKSIPLEQLKKEWLILSKIDGNWDIYPLLTLLG